MPTPPRQWRHGLYLARREFFEMHEGHIGLLQHGVVKTLGSEGLLLEDRRGGRDEEQARQRSTALVAMSGER